MDPINYTPLLESNTPLCMICGQRAPFMFFPCGCTHSIHGKCLPIWRQHKGICPGCNKAWIDAVQIAVETPLENSTIQDNQQNEHNKQYDYKCMLAFICCILTFIGLGAIYIYYELHGGKY